MNYNFYVGDYAETKDGEIGYVTEVKFSGEAKRWCSMRIMCGQNNSIISFEGYENSVPDRFNRIGRYDFTKKDEDKIEPLIKSVALDDEINKGKITFNFREIINKINELVNAVNELREKAK